jgi:hypothetical protein
MKLILGEWREGKVRPIPGNTPHDRPVSRVISCSLWSICDDSFVTTRFPQLSKNHNYRAPNMRFQGMAESFTPMWFKSKSKPKTNPEPGSTASRRSAPTQVGRTRREDRALLIVCDEFRPAIP